LSGPLTCATRRIGTLFVQIAAVRRWSAGLSSCERLHSIRGARPCRSHHSASRRMARSRERTPNSIIIPRSQPALAGGQRKRARCTLTFPGLRIRETIVPRLCGCQKWRFRFGASGCRGRNCCHPRALGFRQPGHDRHPGNPREHGELRHPGGRLLIPIARQCHHPHGWQGFFVGGRSPAGRF